MEAWKAALALPVAWALASPATAAGDARGILAYKDRKVEVRYAYLVRGPDAVTREPVRRLVLSARDLSAKIASCKTMSCTDSGLEEGISVNLVSGPRFNYWTVMNGQKIQYSGTEPYASLTAKVDDPARLAGTLRFDKTAAGGPNVDVEFDATLLKEVSAP